MMPFASTTLRRFARRMLPLLLAVFAPLAVRAADDAKKTFSVPAGNAAQTLKQFAQQAAREIVFSPEVVADVKTNVVSGELAPRAALDQMLAGTGLVAAQEQKTGAFAVRRKAEPAAEKNGSSPATKRSANVDGPVLEMAVFAVTGSRVQRLEGEGPQPVVSFTGEAITRSGFATLGDFMQAQSFNSGATGNLLQPSATGVGVAFSRGASTLNPRGLGAGNFLVLVNGRRATAYANPDSNGAAVFDFKSIPTEAVDRVEFLKDGASAIYGSDAITGVMNIQLKKNYRGLATDVMVGGAVSGPTTLTRSANLLTGASDAKSSVLVDVGWFKQNPTFYRDYGRSRTSDFTWLGPVKGIDGRSTQNYPANINLTAAQATAAGLTTGAGNYVVAGGQPVANPTKASFQNVVAAANIPAANKFDFGDSGLVPTQENWNTALYATHEINDRLSAFAQIIASDAHTVFTYSPTPIRDTSVLVSPIFQTAIPNNVRTTSNTSLIIPAANPFNPFRVNLTSFLFRASFNPPRIFDVETKGASSLVGLKGKLGGDWTWESGFSYGYSLFTQAQANVLRADDLQNALNGTLYGNAGLYLNPFGPSDPQLVKTLFITSTNVYKSRGYDGDFSATGPLFPMPGLLGLASAGNVSLAAGGEWHQDKIDANPDSANLVGTINGSPFVGKRTVASEFAELAVPVLKKFLDLQVAVRHEDYSDFGATTKAKFAFGSQLTGFLKLRGSYSQSFKAPDLGQLYGGGITFSAATADPLNPATPSLQYKQIIHANPGLKPEQGKVWYAGTVIDLPQVVKGLSLTVDYTNITINDAIVPTSSFTTAQIFTYFPKLVVRNPADNSISYFDVSPFNGTSYYYRGYDFGLDYKLRRTRAGDFNFSVQATRILYLAYDPGTGQALQNVVGRYGFGGEVQRWSGNAQLAWTHGRLGASLAAVYKGPVRADANGTVAAGSAWGVNPIALLNASASCAVPWGTRLTLGCNNLMNTEPPLNGRIGTAGFDLASYGAWANGRYVYVKLKKEF